MSVAPKKTGFSRFFVAFNLRLTHAIVLNQAFLTTTPPLVAIDLQDALQFSEEHDEGAP